MRAARALFPSAAGEPKRYTAIPMEHTDIWTRWAMHYRDLGIDPTTICRDGIADKSKFDEASSRILFIMREPNDWPGGDMCQLMREGPRYQVWHTIGRWAAGLLNGFPDFAAIDNTAAMRDALHQIASINLKKASGGSSADLSVINAFAFRDRALMREQILTIAPSTIVACGTWHELVWLLKLPVSPKEPRQVVTSSTLAARVIPWVHPSRCDNRRTYQTLGELVSQPTATAANAV